MMRRNAPYPLEFRQQMIEDLAQLDRAFGPVAARDEPVESFHQAVNSLVSHVFFALYRDFPDPGRVRGEEKF